MVIFVDYNGQWMTITLMMMMLIDNENVVTTSLAVTEGVICV